MMLFFKRLFTILFLFIGFSQCSFNGSDDFSLNLEEISPLPYESFVELFHAFEINELENLKLEPISMPVHQTPAYSDFIIQKYSLWHPSALYSVLSSYQSKKEELYTNEEHWGKALLDAQNYQPQYDWKNELKNLEKDNKDFILNYTKTKNPQYYKLIESLQNEDFQESDKLNEKLKISENKFEDWAVDNQDEVDKRINHLMRILSRHYFKENLEQETISR